MFTNKHGNTIDEDNETGSGANVDADDVTGVDNDENNYTEENADINAENIADINSHNREPIDHDITGMTHDVTDEEPTNHDITGVTHDVRKFTQWLVYCFYKIIFYPHNFI